MKHCNACHVDVATPSLLCPLCRGPLVPAPGPAETAVAPLSKTRNFSYVKRLLLLLSVIGVGACILINLFVTQGFWWWLLAALGVVYAWATVLHAMRRGGNAGGIILMQVICACALAVLVDFVTDWHRWSVTYLLPGIFCAGIIAVVVLIVCNRTNWAGYVLYQVVLTAFGFIPLVLFFTGVSRNFWFALAPSLLAAVSLLGLFLFGDRTIKNEFRRRFRF
ncbi:MAG: DUF6320 domain-containing protein [Ruthenibacterium sp.]